MSVFLNGCASKKINPAQIKYKVPTSEWLILNVSVQEGNKKLVYTLQKDGLIRSVCISGRSSVSTEQFSISKQTFDELDRLVLALKQELMTKSGSQRTGRIFVRLVLTPTSEKITFYRKVNESSVLQNILSIFKTLRQPSC
ncbi:MAG: hypothetical protein NZO16_06180, partial [Deltaproteobacteria bacterium]|nr:hypothetical protein [Deltaproteobacteria bacterium]